MSTDNSESTLWGRWWHTIRLLVILVGASILINWFGNRLIDRFLPPPATAPHQVQPLRADSARIYRNRWGEAVAARHAQAVESEKLLDHVLQLEQGLQHLRADFKHVRTAAVVHTITQLPPDTIPFAVSAPCRLDLPFARSKLEPGTRDTLYHVAGRVTDAGVVLSTVQIPARLSLIVGEPKGGGFLRPAAVEVRAFSDNPYVQIGGLGAVEVRPPRRWYERPWVWLAAGAVGGVVLGR